MLRMLAMASDTPSIHWVEVVTFMPPSLGLQRVRCVSRWKCACVPISIVPVILCADCAMASGGTD